MKTTLLTALLVVTCMVATVLGQNPLWTEVLSTNGQEQPPARKQAIMSFWENGNSLVLYGGRDNGGNVLADVWMFNVVTKTWRMIVDNQASGGASPRRRFSLAGGVDNENNKLIIFGGETDGNVILNDIWSLDLASANWTELNSGLGSDAPETRYGHAGGIVKLWGTKYFITSHGFNGGNRWKNSFAFNFGTNTWTEITPQSGEIPFARCLVAGAAMNDAANPNLAKLGMFGGCGSGGYGPCPSSEMWILNITMQSPNSFSTQWQFVPQCLNARNFGAMAADPSLNGGTFFVYGGSGGVLVSQDLPGQLNSLSSQKLQWSQTILDGTKPEQPSSDKQSALAVATGNVMWLQLGSTNSLYMVNYTNTQSFLSLEQQECHNDPIPAWRTAHGVLMGLSWGFLLPIGVFIARFGRVKNPLWFKLHRGIQMVGVTMALAGFVIALLMVSTGKFLAVPHSFIGLVVTFLGFQQPINAYFRPHVVKDEAKTKTRVYWEYWHKYGGRVALALGLINPFWGISYLSGTNSAGFIIYSIWVGIYVFSMAYLTARGLPYTANGPSKLAQWVNSTLCSCLAPWDDSFKARNDSDLDEEAKMGLPPAGTSIERDAQVTKP